MAFRDTWHRALVYFGLAEDPEYREPELYEPDTGPHGELYESPAPRSGTVSPLRERRRPRDEIDDIFAEDEPMGPGRTRPLRPVGGNGGADVRVHLVTPCSFDDAQGVADQFKLDVSINYYLLTMYCELMMG